MSLASTSEEHFARVAPIVGAALRQTRVALIGLPIAAPIATYLAACGVRRWLWAADAEGSSVEALRAYLLAQHGPALALDAVALPPSEWSAAIRHDPPDLVVVAGGDQQLALALDAATHAGVPALLIIPPIDISPCRAITIFPGDDFTTARSYLGTHPEAQSKIQNRVPLRGESKISYDVAAAKSCFSLLADAQSKIQNRVPLWGESKISYWDWLTAAPLCAGLARAILLRDTPFRRADLAQLWAAGNRIITIGAEHPFDITSCTSLTRSPAHPLTRSFCTLPARRGTLLIAGLGSLGSVAAAQLAHHAHTFVLADPDRVDAYNPVRQAYPLASVGRSKAHALRDLLRGAGARHIIALDTALDDERAVVALVEHLGITAALVATGAADFVIARALRACGVPHVVGRCYPRARYWEAIVVDGRRGPALSDIRGQITPGPTPAPTPEQIAAYSDAGALEAEPATLIESGWAAAWLARLTAQLLAPTGLRERWMLDLLAAERTCLVGGVGVEHTPAGPAYAITLPGQIHAWARDTVCAS